MNFLRAEPNAHYRDLRLVSAGRQWELGLSLYASGMRLRMGRMGRPPSVLDFCIGQDATLFAPILQAVLLRLETLNESSTPREIDACFPWAGSRPDLALHLDALLSSPSQELPASHGPHELSIAHRDLTANGHD